LRSSNVIDLYLYLPERIASRNWAFDSTLAFECVQVRSSVIIAPSAATSAATVRAMRLSCAASTASSGPAAKAVPPATSATGSAPVQTLFSSSRLLASAVAF
jgi:hypothetical protein